jgi:hemoglobin
VDAHRLRRLVTQFFCGATGGPEHYEGKSVREVHRGMNLGEDEYLAFAGDFASALRAHGVRPREETEFLAILERLKGEALRG